jgi:hypothetical protein
MIENDVSSLIGNAVMAGCTGSDCHVSHDVTICQ